MKNKENKSSITENTEKSNTYEEISIKKDNAKVSNEIVDDFVELKEESPLMESDELVVDKSKKVVKRKKRIKKRLDQKESNLLNIKLPEDFNLDDIGNIDLDDAEKIANENILFLNEDDLVEELEGFNLIPLNDEPLSNSDLKSNDIDINSNVELDIKLPDNQEVQSEIIDESFISDENEDIKTTEETFETHLENPDEISESIESEEIESTDEENQIENSFLTEPEIEIDNFISKADNLEDAEDAEDNISANPIDNKDTVILPINEPLLSGNDEDEKSDFIQDDYLKTENNKDAEEFLNTDNDDIHFDVETDDEDLSQDEIEVYMESESTYDYNVENKNIEKEDASDLKEGEEEVSEDKEDLSQDEIEFIMNREDSDSSQNEIETMMEEDSCDDKIENSDLGKLEPINLPENDLDVKKPIDEPKDKVENISSVKKESKKKNIFIYEDENLISSVENDNESNDLPEELNDNNEILTDSDEKPDNNNEILTQPEEELIDSDEEIVVQKEYLPENLQAIDSDSDEIYFIDDELIIKPEVKRLISKIDILGKITDGITEVLVMDSKSLKEGAINYEKDKIPGFILQEGLYSDDVNEHDIYEYKYWDDDIDFVDSSIFEDDYSRYVREIDDILYSGENEKTIHIIELFGASLQDLEVIDDDLFGEYYREINLNAELGISLSDEIEDRKRVHLKVNSNYFLSFEESLSVEEKKSIEEDITSKNAIIFEESIEKINDLFIEISDKSKKKNKSVEIVDEVHDITELVVILDDEEDVDRFMENIPKDKQNDLKKLLKYLDGLFEKLPENIIQKFAESEYFDLYAKVLSDIK